VLSPNARPSGRLTFLVSWGNTITSIVDSTVKNVLKVDPTKIYDQYQNALEMQKTSDNNTSWWQKVFEMSATIFESLISAFLWLLGWVASAIVFYAYILQKIILYMGTHSRRYLSASLPLQVCMTLGSVIF